MFWPIVGAVLVVVLAAAWWSDHQRKVSITRRNGQVESDIARASVHTDIHLRGGSDGFGPTGL